MRAPRFDAGVLQTFLATHKIAMLAELKGALGTAATMTVFRRLRALGYLTSYSHRGKYYTLAETPDLDERGLWSHESVWFSKYGNLLETAREFVEDSEAGRTARELEGLLHVDVKGPLLKLCRDRRVHRQKISGVYVYLSADRGRRKRQVLMRQGRVTDAALGVRGGATVPSHELKAAIILFFSLLDEQQRRLYAGLESHKLGHGGDRVIAALLGLDPHTVARGRTELLGAHVDRQRTRKTGGGRKPVEKKRRPSSRPSRS